MTDPNTAAAVSGNVKPLVPKQNGRIATIETQVAQLRADHDKLKRIVAGLMMSNPQIQERLQDWMMNQMDMDHSESP